jgi:hypothetical protein
MPIKKNTRQKFIATNETETLLEKCDAKQIVYNLMKLSQNRRI